MVLLKKAIIAKTWLHMKYAIPVLLGYVNGQKGNDLLFEIPSVLTVILPVPHSDELPKPIFYYLLSGDVFQKSVHSLKPMQYERPLSLCP